MRLLSMADAGVPFALSWLSEWCGYFVDSIECWVISTCNSTNMSWFCGLYANIYRDVDDAAVCVLLSLALWVFEVKRTNGELHLLPYITLIKLKYVEAFLAHFKVLLLSYTEYHLDPGCVFIFCPPLIAIDLHRLLARKQIGMFPKSLNKSQS